MNRLSSLTNVLIFTMKTDAPRFQHFRNDDKKGPEQVDLMPELGLSLNDLSSGGDSTKPGPGSVSNGGAIGASSAGFGDAMCDRALKRNAALYSIFQVLHSHQQESDSLALRYVY